MLLVQYQNDRLSVSDAFPVQRLFLKRKGLDADQVKNIDRKQYKEEQYDKLADIIRENLDMKMVYEIIERGGK